MNAGQLVRVTSRRTFKLAIVLDQIAGTDKVRVCIWSANSNEWTRPQIHRRGSLSMVHESAAVARQRRVIRDAADNILHAGGFVHYKDGGSFVGSPAVLP